MKLNYYKTLLLKWVDHLHKNSWTNLSTNFQRFFIMLPTLVLYRKIREIMVRPQKLLTFPLMISWKNRTKHCQYLTGAAGADEWHTAKSIVLKENKKVHFGKIANHWASLISTQDSKQIWEAINWKGDAAGDAALPKKTPSSDDLARHFFTKGDDHCPLDVSCIHNNQYVEVLDKPVFIEEVYESANHLKEKSTCDD